MPTTLAVRRAVVVLLVFGAGCSYFRRGPKATAAKPATTTAAKPVATTATTTAAAPTPAKATTKPQPKQKAPVVKAGPTDSQIAGILLAVNNTDVSYANLAPARSKNAAVKEFASQMVASHKSVNKLVSDLITATNVTPEESKLSLDLRDESAAKRDMLRELSGAAFDSTYLANEISYHTRLLSSIDATLLPAARSAQLRQLIQNLRPAVAAHLAHAEELRSSVAAR